MYILTTMDELGFMTPSAQRLALRAADQQKVVPFWPRWMQTRWGQWLARHWKPARVLWYAEVKLAETRETEAREAAAAEEAMAVFQIWAETNFSQPMSEDLRLQLIRAWCKWRTYHERKCERAGCEPFGSAEWIANSKKAFAAPPT